LKRNIMSKQLQQV